MLQYSLRSLLLFVLLAAIVLGAWEATKNFAADERERELVDTYEYVPLIITRDKYEKQERRYYLWLFGPTFELPFASHIDQHENAGTYP
jgi:hypothetical protein